MDYRKLATDNPKTSVLAIITLVSSLWEYFSENAELFGVSGKTIMIGGVILTASVMVYNNFTGGELPPDDDE